MQLKKAYYNWKPVEKPWKNKEVTSNQEMENASTEEGHDSKLKTEMKKKPDIKTIYSLLKASFNHRRKWISKLQGKGTVKILAEYPGFKDWQQVIVFQLHEINQLCAECISLLYTKLYFKQPSFILHDINFLFLFL